MIDLLLAVSALGCALMAGFLYTFSICVMRALAALPPQQGMSAMRSINVVILNPWFLLPYFGLGLLCVLLIVGALMRWPETRATWALAGGLLYLIGTLLVTMIFNVPRNNALARAALADSEGATLWADYLVIWTRWNHVRVIAAFGAAAAFIVALRS